MQAEKNSMPANNSSLHTTLVSRNETLLQSRQRDFLDCAENFFYIHGSDLHIKNLIQLLSTIISKPNHKASLSDLAEEFDINKLDKAQVFFLTTQLISFLSEAQTLFDKSENHKHLLEELKSQNI